MRRRKPAGAAQEVSVYFDGDGTLWDFQAIMRNALASTITELRRRVPALDGDLSVEAFIADRDDVAREHPEEVRHERLREMAFAASLRRLGADDAGLASELTSSFLRRRFTNIAVYPDVIPCLETLRRNGFRVGLLSNGNTDPRRFGLGHLFDAVVFAHDVGAPKPDGRMYRAAENALPAEQYVMIGDDPTDDVAEPERVGWQAWWLNRGGETAPISVHPDRMEHDLRDVPQVLRDIGLGPGCASAE